MILYKNNEVFMKISASSYSLKSNIQKAGAALLFIDYITSISSLNLSAIIAINSEFVGFPFALLTVYPNSL